MKKGSREQKGEWMNAGVGTWAEVRMGNSTLGKDMYM